MTGSFCQVCARKWMRQLLVGHCVCTGHVVLTFVPPGGQLARHQFIAPKKVASDEDKNAAVKEELHLPPEKTITKKFQAKIEKYKAAMAKKPK